MPQQLQHAACLIRQHHWQQSHWQQSLLRRLQGEIRVTDGGRGMSEAELERFGVMRQFGREKFEQQGIGMGLGLARNFAQRGGGNFALVRNVPGPGMTACLTLVRSAG